jgi:hypothetical protein
MIRIMMLTLCCLLIASCGKPMPPPQAGQKKSTPSQPVLPQYVVIEKMNRLDGVMVADVLIESYSRETPVAERTRAAKGIAEKERFDQVSVYCKREAQKAQYSVSFQQSHPDALKTGYLGSYEDGSFTPGEKYFP